MSEMDDLAGSVAAVFLCEIAKRTAGPVTEWLNERLGTKKVAEQVAADVEDQDAKAELIGSVRRALEAHPMIERDLRATLSRARIALQIGGDNVTLIQFQGDNNTVQR